MRHGAATAALATCGPLLLLGATAPAAELVGARIGDHGRYTRVVFELSEAVEHRIEGPDPSNGNGGGEIRVFFAAAPAVISLPAPRGLVGSLVVEPEGSRAGVARIRARDGRIGYRVTTLQDPARIVLDLEPIREPLEATRERRGVVDVRVGLHEGYTRVVFELDAPAEHRLERSQGDPELLLALEAPAAARTIRPARGVVESVTLEPEGLRASLGRIRLRNGALEGVEVRRLVLSDPPRIVVDARAELPDPAGAAERPSGARDEDVPSPDARPAAPEAAPPQPRRASALGRTAPRVVDVRVGDHGAFTRVVFELDAPAAHSVERPKQGGLELGVTLAASSAVRTVSSRGGLVTSVEIEPAVEGSRARLRLHEPDVEVEGYTLTNPPRLVFDLRRGSSSARGPEPGPLRVSAAAPPAPEPSARRSPPPPSAPEPAPVSAGAGPSPDEADGAPAEPPGTTETPGAVPLRSDGLAYAVTAFTVQFAEDHPDHPPVEEMLALEVELCRTAQGFVAPRDGVPTETIRLGDAPPSDERRFYASAIQAINAQIVAAINRRGLAGVLVLPHEEDVDRRSRRDLRPPEQTDLRLVIWTGRLSEYRTFASGPHLSEEERADGPRHARIKEHSPVQPGDLIHKDELDAYVARLNRHPGRQVDYALQESTRAGRVHLDFLVAESRPLTLYVQGANTGTEETTRWRQRFGLSDTQLTGRDDVLQLDFITGDFDEVFAGFGSYEAPLWTFDRLRWRVGGLWSQYDASQFGFVESTFEGDQWEASGQILANVWQAGSFFLDLFAGPRYEHVKVHNDPLDSPAGRQDGETGFFLPEIGLRAERASDTVSFNVTVGNEWNLPGIAGTARHELSEFGRTDVEDKHFSILRWSAGTNVYLEPLLFPGAFRDPTNRWQATLAHELSLSSQGQYSWGDRLIPQYLGIAGGLYTVRGYPQSSVASDSLVLGHAEYLLHLPRLLGPERDPVQLPWIGPFRWAPPQQPFGRPDWDFVVRGFFDAGRTYFADAVPGEENQTLLGAGVGAELRLRTNLILRFDWGRALRSVRLGNNDVVHRGNDQFYFVGTLLR